jgi:hypothetical protein
MNPDEYLQHILSSLPTNLDLPSGIALGLSCYYSSDMLRWRCFDGDASMEMLRWRCFDGPSHH